MEYNYSKEDLLYMYHHLKNGRLFTLKMHEAVYKGLVRSSFHTPYGQEAIGVGIVSAMRDTDWLGFTHRLQTAEIMRFDLYSFIAELFGMRDGLKHGAAFDFHLSDLREDGKRVLAFLATLGGSVPMNTGFAWARRQMGKDEVAIIPHGDGGCSEGAVFEGWNIAALYKAPVVFVIENNEWAMTVPLDRESPVKDICRKAEACGLPAQIADGNNVLEVRRVMEDAIEKARAGQPNVVELKTLRWEAHFIGQGNDYRHDKEKIEYSMKHDDCVKRFESYLMENGIINQEYIDNLTDVLNNQLDEMIERAKNSEKPKFDDVYRMEYIYANPTTGGDL